MQKQTLAKVLELFAGFSVNERRILIFLSSHHVFCGGYSDLCRALNLDIKKQCSNVRKSCLSLQRKGLIYLDKKCMFLVPDWDLILISLTH